MSVDVASKPTLASYDIRPDAFDPHRKRPNALQTAKDPDDAMLAVVDRHSEVADGKIRTRDFKGAITLLKRTLKLVEHHESPVPGDGERPLVVRLASACVQLQLCVALSRIGRHAPALSEATRAKEELDDLWSLLTGAALDMAMAEAGGDANKPHPVLRSHICHPPNWLERAVCSAIQARLCMALEMEYLLSSDELQSQRSSVLPPIVPSQGVSSDPVGSGLVELDTESLEEDEGLNVGLPLPPLSELQRMRAAVRMWQLYLEAKALAEELLPEGHPLKSDAEKASVSALARWAPDLDVDVASLQHSLSPTGSLQESLKEVMASPATPVSPKDTRASLAKESSKLPELFKSEEEEWMADLPSMLLSKNRKPLFNRSATMPSLERKVSVDQPTASQEKRRNTDSASHGDWVKRAPPGDVFYRSLPWSFGTKSPKNRRRKKKADAMTVSEVSDPFKDWAKEFMHLENMTLFQRKLRTLDGISSLHTDMKIETKRFRQFMQDLELYGGEEQERLGNNRILYTEAGMKALRLGQQRNEALRKAAWQTSPWGQKFMEREKQLFGYYGLGKQYEKGIDVKCLRKLMEESFNRTPAEKQRKKNLEEQRKKQEMEEAEQQKRELAQIGFRKQKTKSIAKAPTRAQLRSQGTMRLSS